MIAIEKAQLQGQRGGGEGRSGAMTAHARSLETAGAAPSISIRNYVTVTAAYWAFTLTARCGCSWIGAKADD